jgi:hypothetical protein
MAKPLNEVDKDKNRKDIRKRRKNIVEKNNRRYAAVEEIF